MEIKARKAAGQSVAYDLMLFTTATLRETPEALEQLHYDYLQVH